MSQSPCIPGLFDQGARRVSDASLEAWERLLPTLTTREIDVFVLVCDYLEQTGRPSVTGGELAEWSGRLVTSIRPRICGLVDKRWLNYGEMRPSRAAYEGRCHPVSVGVPRQAVERARHRKMEVNS